MSSNREIPQHRRTAERPEPRDATRTARERDQAVRELLELEHAATEGPETPQQP